MKKILLLLLIGLSIQITNAFDPRPFVVAEVNNQEIIVSDMQTSLIATKINTNNIDGSIPDIEPGIIAMISCTADNNIRIQNASDTQVAAFNQKFDQIGSFFEWYDPIFVEKIKTLYRQSPRENYIIKALLATRLASIEFQQIRYNSTTPNYPLKNIQEFCFTKPNQLQEKLERDRFFLNTVGKDLTQKSNIIARDQRWADESMSMPIPPSSEPSPPSTDQPWHTPTNVSTIRSNYLKNFEPIDKPRTVRHSVNGIRRAMEYFPADRIIIHHTAGSYRWTKEAGIDYMKSLQQYHGRRLGRWDIGYHFLIDGEGNVYEWRRWGMHVVWAQALGHNRGSIGISLMSDRFYSRAMLISLIDLIIFLGEEYNIDIGGMGEFKNADLSGTEYAPAIIGHKEIDKGKPLDPMIPMDIFRKVIDIFKPIWPLSDKVY